jgi:hypothetical protein
MRYDERYETVLASDIVRDGMWLELYDRQSSGELALTAFYSDLDGSFEFGRHQSDVPPEVEEWFRREAQRRLPPCHGG